MNRKLKYVVSTVTIINLIIIVFFLIFNMKTMSSFWTELMVITLLVVTLFLMIYTIKKRKPVYHRALNAVSIITIIYSCYFIFNSFFIYSTKVYTDNMEGVVSNPKSILVQIFNYKSKINDVVYYEYGRYKYSVSRLRAVSGDELSFEFVNDEEVYLLINDIYIVDKLGNKYNVLENNALYNLIKSNNNQYILSQDQYLVIGENFTENHYMDMIIGSSRLCGKVLGV